MRSKSVFEENRQLAMRLYMQGISYGEIARRCGVSIHTVNSWIVSGRKQWATRFAAPLQEHKEAELAKIDNLEAEFWVAWNESKEEHVFTQIRIGAEGERMVTERRVPMQAGNPVFLAGVERCIQARRDLLGLDAPKKQALTDTEGNDLIPLAQLRTMYLEAGDDDAIEVSAELVE